jgi:hypothetical protein
MKKPLLFTFLLASTMASAQMTSANEPSIGETSTMFLCDSFAVNLDGITGSAVTWDYSSLLGYYGETRTVDVVDPATTAYASDFTSSTKAFQVESALITYFSSTASDRTSQGFMFSEASLGDVVATYDGGANDQVMVTYPFANGNYLTDTYTGTVDYNYNGFPVNESMNGNAYAWVDGEGTLLLPNSVSVANVIRYKSIDTAFTTAPIIGAVELVRTQYEYYDYASQNLPVFIHTTIAMAQPGGLPLAEVSMVLSKYEANYLSVDEVNEVEFDVYPNPASNNVVVKGDLSADAVATIIDQSGRIILTTEIVNGQSIDISSLTNGIYMITIQDNGFVSTKSIVKE